MNGFIISTIIDNNLYINNFVGIGTNNPNVSLHINSTDAIKLPKGSDANRPLDLVQEDRGLIRYNTDKDIFEGFGAGNEWGSLGGVKDVDGDTYISAEISAGSNNNELRFITSNIQHMIIKDDGKIGIGTNNTVSKYEAEGRVL